MQYILEPVVKDLLPKPFSETMSICGEHQSLPGLQWAVLSGHMTRKHLVKKMRE